MKRKILGYCILALPFIFVYFIGFISLGFLKTTGIFLGVSVLVVWVGVGTKLIETKDEVKVNK